jgi:hypothetical protein
MTATLFKNVVAQFMGLPLCHCEADEVSRSNLVRAMGLPRTFQVLAMTKSEVPDESSNYKIWGERLPKCPKLNSLGRIIGGDNEK